MDRPKRYWPLSLFLLISIILILIICKGVFMKAEFYVYVSPAGNDENPGTIEMPFKSITRARDAVRKIKGSVNSDITVYLREGIYILDTTILFNEKDSGENKFKITYKSYPGEKVIISGGKSLKGWERIQMGNVNDVWRINVPEIENARHLYVDGKSAQRSKTKAIESHAWDVIKDSDFEFFNIFEIVSTYQGHMKVFEGYRTYNTEILNWKNQSDIEFVYDVGWTHCICPVDSIIREGDQAIIRMRMPCFRDCQIKPGMQIGTPSYIENVFELMDETGEWYFDKNTRTIYYVSEEGQDLNKSETIVPTLERLVEIKGKLGDPVCNIVFEDLEFIHTTWLKPGISGHAEIQGNLTKDSNEDLMYHSMYVKPESSVILDAADSVEFRGCRFTKLGSGAIDIRNGSCNNKIIGNELFEIAGSGIQLGGFQFEDAHPDDDKKVVKNNIISNNYIHDIGTEYKGSIGIFAGYVSDTLIAHNEICNVAYSGISVGWGWGYTDPHADERAVDLPPEYYPKYTAPSICKGNRIEYNHIHHVMQRLHDGSAIYTLSMQAGSTIIGNHIHDNGGFNGIGFQGEVFNHFYWQQTDFDRQFTSKKGFPGGIYLDEASGGFLVTGNIIYNVVVPVFYNNVGIPERFESNKIYKNICNIKPDSPSFPQKDADRAGIERKYVKNKNN